MATIAIGHIHGHLVALEDLLGQIAGEVAEGDTVVFLGTTSIEVRIAKVASTRFGREPAVAPQARPRP